MARIPVRSRRQAMDWSLVLVSQGIEITIDHSGADAAWFLVVAPHEMERALKTLRQYRLENRSWNWKPPLHWPETRFDWSCLAWAGAMILCYGLAARNPGWVSNGQLDSTRVMSGQWWRLVTAITLHADLAHLGENLGFGIILFGFVMGRYGAGTGLFAAGLAGIFGNLASLAFNAKPFHGLGASGMVMGALGLLSVASTWRPTGNPVEGEGRFPKISWAGMAAGVMLFVLYGLSPGTDVFAHLGGFGGGLLLGGLLALLPKKLAESRSFNLSNGILLVFLLIASWTLALGRGR